MSDQRTPRTEAASALTAAHRSFRERRARAEPLTSSQYIEWARAFPRPTADQVSAFSQFVSQVHSWYKHLPPTTSGVPFLFFVDPNAGLDRVLSTDNRIELVRRDEHGFGANWLPTGEYRQRFGYLSYCCTHGTNIGDVRDDRLFIPSFDASALIDANGVVWRYPDALVDAGRVYITNRIYPPDRLGLPRDAAVVNAYNAERDRQLRSIEAAIARVCALVY